MIDAVRVPFLIDDLFQFKNLVMCSFPERQENEKPGMQQVTIFIQREELEHLGFSFIGKITFLRTKI